MIAFSGGADATAPAAALPTVTAADLVPAGNAALIADFLQRMSACYALAPTDRVSSSGTTAADIFAPECKDIFLGKDPTSFLDNGAVVSKTGAFSGIFGTDTGATFDRGSYAFTRANGDLVIAYRATNGAGTASANYTMVVRADTDGKLRAIGNQYKYNGGVNAYEQLRTFINEPAANYYSTGYNLNVNNTVDAKRNSIFDRVEVTTPSGNVLTLKPSAGSSYLPLVKGNTLTNTNYVRIRSVYTDAANSGKNPADADANGLFFAATPLADADITVLPAQSTWKFDYFLAGNTGTTADATQYYKTLRTRDDHRRAANPASGHPHRREHCLYQGQHPEQCERRQVPAHPGHRPGHAELGRARRSGTDQHPDLGGATHFGQNVLPSQPSWVTNFDQFTVDSSGNVNEYDCGGGLTCSTSVTDSVLITRNAADPGGVFTATGSDGSVTKIAAISRPTAT